jgi:hypothetical protein
LLFVHSWIGRIRNRRDLPAINRFHQLPDLTAADFGLAIDLDNKIKIYSRDGSIRSSLWR